MIEKIKTNSTNTNLNASASIWVIRLFMNLADSTVDAALRTSLSMERRPASTMSTCVRYGVGKSEITFVAAEWFTSRFSCELTYHVEDDGKSGIMN